MTAKKIIYTPLKENLFSSISTVFYRSVVVTFFLLFSLWNLMAYCIN